MPFFNPNETVYKIVSLPRWQRAWINSHRSINFSGLVQEILLKIINEKDQQYFEQHKHLLEIRQTSRMENIVKVLESVNQDRSQTIQENELKVKLKEQLLKKVKYVDQCWLWQGTRTKGGYGIISPGYDLPVSAVHRLSYKLFKGEIPQGLQLDHLCRNKTCVNPDHLEAVTLKENMKRTTGMPHIMKGDLRILEQKNIDPTNWQKLHNELIAKK